MKVVVGTVYIEPILILGAIARLNPTPVTDSVTLRNGSMNGTNARLISVM